MLQKYPACLFLAAFLLAVLASFLAKSGTEAFSADASGRDVCLTGQVVQKEENGKQAILYLRQVTFCDETMNSKTTQKTEEKNEAPVTGEPFLPEGVLCRLKEGEEIPFLGERVLVKGKVRLFKEAANPGEFCQRKYYQSMGMDFSLEKAGILWGNKEKSHFREGLYRLRVHLSGVLGRLYEEKEASVMRAVLLGEKAGMDETLKKQYQKNGIAHVLAISGLHISFLGMGLYRGFRRFFFLPVQIALVMSGSMLYAYVIMTGSSPSAWRAFLMFVLSLAAEALGRTFHGLTALSLAALFLLAACPYYLTYTGFQLSFGVMVGIFLFVPVMEAAFSSRTAKTLASGVGISLFSLPLLLYTYYQFPVYSVFLNLLVIPLMGLLMLSGVLGLLAGCFFLPLGRLLGTLAEVILFFYEKACLFAENLPGKLWIPGKPEVWQILLFYMALALLIYWKKYISRDFLILSLITALSVVSCRYYPPLEITMLDVGQGDGIFLQDKSGAAYLIDGGSSSEKKLAQYKLLPFLKFKGVTCIRMCFLTHMDKDHISGTEELLIRGKEEGITVEALVLPALEKQDEVYIRICREAKEAGIIVYEMERGERIETAGMQITCLNPGADASGEDKNEDSLVLLWEQKDFSALFTGDIGEATETAVTEAFLRVWEKQEGVTLLKVAHHGSKDSTCQEFLKKTRPKISVISCSSTNTYGHPHPDTLERLENMRSLIRCTKDTGAITLKTDGKKVKVEEYLQK